MKNALIFFYNIFLEEIEKINDNYYFAYQNSDFVIHKYTRNIDEVISIYNLNKEMLQKTFKKMLTVTRWDDKIKKSLEGDEENGLWKLNRI